MMDVQIDPPVADTVLFRELAPGDFFRGASWPNGGQFLYEGEYEGYGCSYVVKTMGRCDGNINGDEPGDVGACEIEKMRNVRVTRLKIASVRFVEIGQSGPDEPPQCGVQPCCDRVGEYNGFGSDEPVVFTCPNNCPCHD